ncbi:MAG: hypothetical protein VB959_10890, partial [Rhodospirillales bacterium]
MTGAKKSRPDQDDAALLELAFQDVTPMDGKKIGKIPKAPPKPKAKISKPVRRAPPVRGEKTKPKPQPDLDHGTAPGLDRRTAQRLKRGRLDVEARLHLHGHTQA